jgi:hypothetical protein
MASLKQLIAAAAAEAGTPEIAPLMEAIVGQESGGSMRDDVINPDSGARGPFQVMPATARMYGFRGSDADLQRPDINARYSALKIADDYKKYKGNPDDVIAAYYQGDNSRGRHGGYRAPAKGGYPSTDEYVAQVKGRMGGTPSMAESMSNALAPQAPADPDAAYKGGEADIQKMMEWLKTQQNQPAIEELYQKHIGQTEQEQAPAPRPVPNAPSLGTRLLSGLAGGLASNITRNPQYFGASQGGLEDVQRKHDYANEMNERQYESHISEKTKRTRMLQDKLHEFQLGQLLDAGDTEKALKLMNTKASLEARYAKEAEAYKAQLKSEEQKQKLHDWLERDRKKEEERRKTVMARAQAVFDQTDMPKAAQIAMQESLDAIQSEYQERRYQLRIMEGGDGMTPEVAQQLHDEETKKIQAVVDAYIKKYPKTTAEGKALPATPVVMPGTVVLPTDSEGAPVDSTGARQAPQANAVAAPPAAETPQQRIARIAREIKASKQGKN